MQCRTRLKRSMDMDHDRGFRKKIVFYLIKQPLILATIIIGLLLEFLIELPFMVMCKLDRTAGDQRPARPSQAGR